MVRFTCFLLAVLLLSGCINHENDYLKEGRQIAPLVVPASVPPIKQDPYYPLPKTTIQPSGTPNAVSLKPATLNN